MVYIWEGSFSCSIVNHLRVEKMRTCSKNDVLQCVKRHC